VNLFATTFNPLPVETQLSEADGVFLGHYLRKKTVELENGKIATQMIFKMNKEYGLQSELLGQEEIIIHYPGGKTPEKTILVEGVPKFVQGEKVLIFTKSIDNRNWGLNLGLGVYKIINYGKETLMINHQFPQHPVVGQVPLTKFESHLREVKKASFKDVYSYQEIGPYEQMRSPASSYSSTPKRVPASENSDEDVAHPRSESVWVFLIVMGLFGGIIRHLRQKPLRPK
jgi:hypothetical protein